MTGLPAFFEIAPPPRGLGLGDDDDFRPRWRGDDDRSRRDRATRTLAAGAFPAAFAVDPLEELSTTKLFACSGSPGSSRYREATRYLPMSEMGWEEARIALNRLVVDPASNHIKLGEFALTADGRTGFVGRKGDHAALLRHELAAAIAKLHRVLDAKLETARRNAVRLARPLPRHGEDMTDVYAVRRAAAAMVEAFGTSVPVAPDGWVQISAATPEQVLAALDCLRSTLATWEQRRGRADDVVLRLQSPNRPEAREYAEALHTAEMLAFTSRKLLSLYDGIIYSMPIYRLYPATAEADALGLWWPWGRPAPLIDGGPPRPPKPKKQTLDPSLITATRPQDVVREVIAKTGINRTTAQAMTADLRRNMRAQRLAKARMLLRQGVTKAEVARAVGLSPSRISALFKGKQSPKREWL